MGISGNRRKYHKESLRDRKGNEKNEEKREEWNGNDESCTKNVLYLPCKVFSVKVLNSSAVNSALTRYRGCLEAVGKSTICGKPPGNCHNEFTKYFP